MISVLTSLPTITCCLTEYPSPHAQSGLGHGRIFERERERERGCWRKWGSRNKGGETICRLHRDRERERERGKTR